MLAGIHKLPRGFVTAFLAAIMPASALAESTEKLFGLWFANDGKLGLVSQAGDSHPYFMFGDCEKQNRHVRLILEIDPKFFADAVMKGQYIVIRVTGGASQEDMTIERIVSSEAGRFSWELETTVGPQTLDMWSTAPHLEFTLGVRGGKEFEAKQKFLLPDENREKALASFNLDCFGYQSSRKP